MARDGMKSTFITQIDGTSTADTEGVGQHRYSGGKWYKWCRANAAITAGQFLGYVGNNGLLSSNVTNDTSVAANRTVAAGVAMGSPTAAGHYLWVQIKGVAVVPTARLASGVADGEAISVSNTDGQATDAGTSPLASKASRGVAGWAIDASDGEVYLDCPW